ncbi:hypothetical protein B0J13DRAFT_615637 [Dactylonectria estremocensis]|uniref:Extracellular membrane protein CFEM domain-containing protein n=1 Tax=Dactylonectria estremocensis TaxID=1079267 RepID=A0A9P9FJK4_9HYPO|nr:hypothetical protein B0J13DRAFT_615637 [Dactylonectria estremocensis]
MRFTIAAIAGFAAMATAATTVSIDPAQASYIACLDDCPSGDVKCQSYCVVVPSPNDAQANATNNCVGECDQGDGSEEDTQKYSKCVQSCISDNYFKTSSGTPLQTDSSDSSSNDSSDSDTASAAATASGSGAEATGASETNSDGSTTSGTATGSSASSTETDSGATTFAIGSVSVFAFFAAVLAL